jgi:cation:H+ antiporter
MLLYIAVFIVAFIILARSSDFLVHSLTSLARLLHLSEYTVAFLFMSIATSIPELFVGLSSALSGIPEFSLGNILGANLINITLVIGLVILLGKGLHLQSKISRRNFWIISGFTFLPLFLASDGVLSRGDGVVLLLAFALYIIRLQKEKEYFTKTVNQVHLPMAKGIGVFFKQSRRFFLGIALLLVSSYLIVWAGKNLAVRTSLSFLAFGMLFVALGTALPELAFGVRAKILRHGSMAVGNSLGSIAFNSTLICGMVSIVNPIELVVSRNLVAVTAFLFVAMFLFNVFVFSKSFISRKEGMLLVAIYLGFLLFEYFEYFGSS